MTATTRRRAPAESPVARAGRVVGDPEAGGSVSKHPGAVQTLVLADFPNPDDARALSPNGRAHWATKRAARAEVASAVLVAATRQRLRPIAGTVRLVFRYVYPDHRRRDLDNATTGVTKAAIDALVRGRWIDADDSETVVGVVAEIVVERGARRLEIAISPADAPAGQGGA